MPCCCGACSEACQSQHSSVYRKGAGTGVGEPTEQFWAAMGERGKVMQYMTKRHRAALLECFMAFHAWRQDQRLPELLLRREAKAEERGAEAAAAFGGVLLQLQQAPYNLSVPQVSS